MKSNNKKRLKIVIFFIVTSLILISLILWFLQGTYPIDRNSKDEVLFKIEQGESIKSISTRLAQDNIIRSPTVFFIVIKYLGIERNLQAGEFRLNKSMTVRDIANTLTHGKFDKWITIIEGWRSEEIAAKLSQKFNIPEIEFIKLSKEGYMFPDTYSVPQDATAGAIINLFVNNFYNKITQKMRLDLEKQKITLDQAVILASIVEREGRNNDDRPIIAGILLNRLRIGMPLQVDATLQYILGYQMQERSWWKKELTQADKEIKSDYNTYLNIGLPPKPISNPGLSSILSIIYPVNTDFLYYLHDLKGVAHYAKTNDEHLTNINKYLY
jgi:UPF0755 protein